MTNTIFYSSNLNFRVHESLIKMYLKIQDIFTRPKEFLPDMSGGRTEFREDCLIIINSEVNILQFYFSYKKISTCLVHICQKAFFP